MGSIDRRKRPRHDMFLTSGNSSTLSDDNGENTPKEMAVGLVEDVTSPPQSFVCPLTMEVMFDPVLDSEGNTYERQALLEWLKANHTSPISRQPLSRRMVIPNIALRDAIHDYMGHDWAERKAKEAEKSGSDTRTLDSESRHRAKVALYLEYAIRKFEGLRGSTLKLNEEGCCAFLCSDFTVILDVPDKVEVFCLYTRNLIRETLTESMKDLILELNFLQGDTRGGCISTKRHDAGQPPEVIFSYTDRISEVSEHDFTNILLNFVETATHLRNRIESIRDHAPRAMPQYRMHSLRHAAAIRGGNIGFSPHSAPSSSAFGRGCDTTAELQTSRATSAIRLGRSVGVNHSLSLPSHREQPQSQPSYLMLETMNTAGNNNRILPNDSLLYTFDQLSTLGLRGHPRDRLPSREQLQLPLQLHSSSTSPTILDDTTGSSSSAGSAVRRVRNPLEHY